MKNKPTLGLGNTLSDTVEILHSSILGRSSFGRLSDLVVAWASEDSKLGLKVSGDIRILIQVLLEFAYPKQNPEPGYFEFAIDQNLAYLSVRFPNQQFSADFVDLEKKLSQYWMATDEVSVLKKNLYPNDRVEVRAHQRLNLIEWRICRTIGLSNANPAESVFEIFVDREEGLKSAHEKYTDLGDLPYQELLTEVYQSGRNKKGSGDFYFQGSSLQEEDEQVRVHFEREQVDLDAEVQRELRFSTKTIAEDDELNIVIKASAFELTTQEKILVEDKSKKAVSELHQKFGDEKENLKIATETLIKEGKIKEYQMQKEVAQAELKMSKLEALLKKKELDGIKKGNTIKILNEKIDAFRGQTSAGTAGGEAPGFKEKALQMYAQLREVKKEKELLEAAMQELKPKSGLVDSKDRGLRVTEGQTQSAQIEDLNKKLERTSRALEAEKSKVKGLFERVVSAEREAQTAVPLIEDLEKKADQALKLAQQHKKELENVKQKLVKADAEKNKIKNELVKTQAQIQTLMKRQAS